MELQRNAGGNILVIYNGFKVQNYTNNR